MPKNCQICLCSQTELILYFNRITVWQLFCYEQVANADCEYPLEWNNCLRYSPEDHGGNHARNRHIRKNPLHVSEVDDNLQELSPHGSFELPVETCYTMAKRALEEGRSKRSKGPAVCELNRYPSRGQ